MNHSAPGLPVHHQLPEFTQTHVHQVCDSIQPSHLLSFPSLLFPIPPRIRVFSSESTLRMRWPKYWSFSFSISLSNEYLGLISFRMDWLDLLAVQGTLKSLLQHHSSLVKYKTQFGFQQGETLSQGPWEKSRCFGCKTCQHLRGWEERASFSWGGGRGKQ